MLIFFRGPPGSGKSHLAKRYFGGILHLEADMFCFKDGIYVFEKDQLKINHALCQAFCADALKFSGCDVMISNTFSRQWEIEPYLTLAKEYQHPYQIFCVKSPSVVARDVPKNVIATMINRWEDFEDEIVLNNPIGERDPMKINAAVTAMNFKVVDWAGKVGFDIFSRTTPISNSLDMNTMNITDINDLDGDEDGTSTD
ncbi:MAG: AAA family ATPase [Candidatus Thorarchaeota archaeon]